MRLDWHLDDDHLVLTLYGEDGDGYDFVESETSIPLIILIPSLRVDGDVEEMYLEEKYE